MSKVKYLIRCIFNLNFKNMFHIAKMVSQKSKKPYFVILFDMAYCGLVYGAGYYDYQEFEFYLLNRKERKTYLTRVKNNNLIKKYNNKEYFYILDDKSTFNEKFNKYLKREYLVVKDFEEFSVFFKKHKEIIAKPLDGEGGKGIDKYIYKNNSKEVYNEITSKKQTLVEECIHQHKEMAKLYDKSVNTLRLFTFLSDEGESHVVNQILKIGNGGVTDNFSSGSMYTFLSDEGEVLTPAIDQNDSVFEIHPLSKEKIVGFKVPLYEEAKRIVNEAAKLIPEVRYIGWDVAITNDGPAIIEGNSFPGVFQMKPSLKRNMGLIPKYKKYHIE